MLESIIKFSQTRDISHGCEMHMDCKYVEQIEDERGNRLAYIYDVDKKTLYIMNKNFATAKIKYIPNEHNDES